jgi:hypothetical protein
MTMPPTADNAFPLTDEERACYEEDGFVVLRDVVPRDLRDRLRQVLAAEVERLAVEWRADRLVDDTHDSLPFETRYAGLRRQLPAAVPTAWRKRLVSRPIYELWQRPELLGRIRTIVGDEVYAHGIWSARPREPHTAVQKILWHQDAHYYKNWAPTDGKLVSLWFPLVPVDQRSGCLQFMPGSHNRGWIHRTMGWVEPTGGSTVLFTVPDETLREFTPYSAVMNSGDAVLFSDTTLHQSLHNVSEYVRWSIDIRFGEATQPIVDKTPTGYRCFSASDPGRVESFEQWRARYDYTAADLDAELENFTVVPGGLEGRARKVGAAPGDLDLY